LPVKNNIGARALGLGYHIETKTITSDIIAPYIRWSDEPVNVTADQAIAAANAALRDGGSMKEAKEFLRDLLAKGPIAAKDGQEAADANRISERTLKRAKKELDIKSRRAALMAAGPGNCRREGCQEGQGCQRRVPTYKFGTLRVSETIRVIIRQGCQ